MVNTYSFVDLLVAQTQTRMLTIAMIRMITTVASATGRTIKRISCCFWLDGRTASDDVGGQFAGVLGAGGRDCSAVVTGACGGIVPSEG